MIKKIQNDAGVRIQFKPDDGSTPDKIAHVMGPPERCQHAAQIITDLLQNVRHAGLWLVPLGLQDLECLGLAEEGEGDKARGGHLNRLTMLNSSLRRRLRVPCVLLDLQCLLALWDPSSRDPSPKGPQELLLLILLLVGHLLHISILLKVGATRTNSGSRPDHTTQVKLPETQMQLPGLPIINNTTSSLLHLCHPSNQLLLHQGQLKMPKGQRQRQQRRQQQHHNQEPNQITVQPGLSTTDSRQLTTGSQGHLSLPPSSHLHNKGN
eukprot:g46854.t1